jgi:hypothetical protein
LFTGGSPRRPYNLTSHNTGPNNDTSVTIDHDHPYNLVPQLKAAGYSVGLVGKFHLTSEVDLDNNPHDYLMEMGFDWFDAIIPGNPSQDLGQTHQHTSNNCFGHNHWWGVGEGGAKTLYGDGSGGSSGYTNLVIKDSVVAKIGTIDSASEKWVLFVGWSAPHGPWDAGLAANTCDYDDDGTPEAARNDRPPGSAATNDIAVYNDAFEKMDEYIGDVNATLDLAAGGDADTSVFFFDNGAPSAGATTECYNSRGMKGTPYPCGTEPGLLVQGGASPQNGIVTSLLTVPDISATLVDLAGGTYRGRPDGISFADCIDGTTAPGSCPELRDVACSTQWAPMGGNTDGTIARQPLAADAAGEWDDWSPGCVTRSCGSNEYLLARAHDVDGTDPTLFCEHLYERTSTSDYLSTSPLLETDGEDTGIPVTCTSGADNLNDGKIALSAAPSSDAECALKLLQPALDGMSHNNGAHTPLLRGGSF